MTATRSATAIVTIAAAATSILFTAWVPAEGWLRLALIAPTVALSTVLARWACQATSPSQAVLRSIGGGALHTVFAGAFLLPLFLFIEQGSNRSDGLFFSVALLALVMGAPLGAIIGLAYSVVPAIAAGVRARPSHGDVDRVLVYGGGWLLTIAAIHCGLIVTGTDWPSRFAVAVQGLWLVPLVLGILLLGATAFRARQRAALLSSARTGENTRFRIVAREDAAAEPLGVMPLHHGVAPESCSAVLVRIAEPHREVLYREAAEPEAKHQVVALLH